MTKCWLLVAVAALAVALPPPSNGGEVEWKTFIVDDYDNDNVEHVWRMAMIEGAVHALYLNDRAHAVTVVEYDGEPFVRWTAEYSDVATRPPFPYDDMFSYYGFRH